MKTYGVCIETAYVPTECHPRSGLILAPMIHALLEPNPFQRTTNPALVVVYMQCATQSMIKMADAIFAREQNEWNLSRNIQHACFRMLDELVSDQFKVSNSPTLMEWNTSMSIMDMLDQLETMYNKPNAMTLFANNTLFRSTFSPNDAPKALFHCIEQCQEIAVLARDPYSGVQLINNAIRLLMQASIFSMKEFDDWEAVTPKTHPVLKTIIAAANTCRILLQQLRNTAGQMGYVPQTHNMYAALNDDNDATTATDGTTTTLNVVAMTTRSTLMGAQATAIPESIANAINQLSANQAALMTQISQIAAMSLAQRPQTPSFQTTHTSPIQQIAILAIQPFSGAATGGFQAGTLGGGERGGRNMRNGRSGRGTGCGGGCNKHTSFANYHQRQQEQRQQGQGRGAGGFFPKDRQGSSPRHCQAGSSYQQHPRSTLSSGLQITTCVIRAGLTSKTGTLLSRAQGNGASQTTKMLLPARTYRATLQQDEMHAPKVNTRTCSRDFDGVG